MNYFLKQGKLLLFNPRIDAAVGRDWVSRLISLCSVVKGGWERAAAYLCVVGTEPVGH